MTTTTLIVLFMSALFAASLFLAYIALRRRQDRIERQAIASLQRRRSAAWERLGNSAAGAP